MIPPRPDTHDSCAPHGQQEAPRGASGQSPCWLPGAHGLLSDLDGLRETLKCIDKEQGLTFQGTGHLIQHALSVSQVPALSGMKKKHEEKACS